MKREEVLKASRKENKNKDLPEMEILYQAGFYSVRAGALACFIISVMSSMLTNTLIYSPWFIYFSIIATQWSVRFVKIKRRSDLVLSILFFCLAVLAFVGFVHRLLEVKV